MNNKETIKAKKDIINIITQFNPSKVLMPTTPAIRGNIRKITLFSLFLLMNAFLILIS